MAIRRTDGIIKAVTAEGAVGEYRICKLGSSDDQASEASAATDILLGVSTQSATTGQQFGLAMSGIADVEYGGTVTRGEYLTSDADGNAVGTTTGNNFVIGIAMVAGSDGDIGSVLIDRMRY